MDSLVSDGIIEQLKVIDDYVSTGDYTIIVVCPSVKILQYVVSLVVKKCVLLHKCGYVVIPYVRYNEDLYCARTRIDRGDVCILGFRPKVYKSHVRKILEDMNKYAVITVDDHGVSSKITIRGE